MKYKVISKTDDLYTVELVHDGVLYRSHNITDVDFVSLDNATDEDIWKLLTPLHFFCDDICKIFGL